MEIAVIPWHGLRIDLQNAPFCIAKRTILHRKTHRFGTQNAPF